MTWKLGETPRERMRLKGSGERQEKLMGGLERQNIPGFPSQEESGFKHIHDMKQRKEHLGWEASE